MFVKLAVLACSVAVALGAWNGPLAGGVPAHQYPAGVSPQACPNFPHCSNPALAANPDAPAPIYNQNAYNQNAYNPGPYAQHQGGVGDAHFTGAYSPQGSAESGQYTGDGDYKGEGLPESGAYGPHSSWNNDNNAAPQWNAGHNQWNGAPAWNAQPAHAHAQPAQVPAGVDAHACPNYPFCH